MKVRVRVAIKWLGLGWLPGLGTGVHELELSAEEAALLAKRVQTSADRRQPLKWMYIVGEG